MSRKYDSRTTIFSPEGRLYQVEYAMEAIGQAGTCLGIKSNEGIILAAEHRNLSPLLDESTQTEKIYRISGSMAACVAGITADANVLIKQLRLTAESYKLQWGESMPCEQMVAQVCDLKHAYTQYGGKRPFGVSLLYAGWDKHFGYQLYCSDPSGNYEGWSGVAIGSNHTAAMSILEENYDSEKGCTWEEALKLVVKILLKTFEVSQLSVEKIEMATLKLADKDRIEFKVLSKEERQKIVDEYSEKEKMDAQEF